MTEQQKPHKWQSLIEAWAGGARVDRKFKTDSVWDLIPDGITPSWDNPSYEFRIHDPYREFREAQDRGEVVEFKDSAGRWIGGPARCAFDYPPNRYRIAKPEPKPGVSAHQANEWADAATNGLQWLLNIRDGISTVDDAIEDLMRDISRCRNVQPEPKEEELYVLVTERDVYEGVAGGRPIVHEQFLDKGAASLDRILTRKARLGSDFGKTRIAKLQFIDEDAKS